MGGCPLSLRTISATCAADGLSLINWGVEKAEADAEAILLLLLEWNAMVYALLVQTQTQTQTIKLRINKLNAMFPAMIVIFILYDSK